MILEKPPSKITEFASDAIGVGEPVTYLEFGVAHGNSIVHSAKLFTNPDSRFIGFDSFHGLPERWLHLEAGAFSRDGNAPSMDDPRIRFVQGWFQNSVPEALRTLEVPENHTVLITFDSDLYSSTLFLLATLWARIEEYYFIFSDFIHDEVVALSDFLAAFPADIEFFAQTRGGGDPPNPDQVFGRMKRKVFAPSAP